MLDRMKRTVRPAVDEHDRPTVAFHYLDFDGAPLLCKGKQYVVHRYVEDEARGIHARIAKRLKDGTVKRQRFKAPPGALSQVYVPSSYKGLTYRERAAIALKRREPLCIVEGQLKTEKLAADGKLVVGISGVSNFASKKRGVKLNAMLVEVIRDGHSIVILYDSDVSTNSDVKAARGRFRRKATTTSLFVSEAKRRPSISIRSRSQPSRQIRPRSRPTNW